MPVFIEWKLEEQRQSLIAIFHFYDDFSKTNLRLIESSKAIEPGICSREELIMAERPWISWAPSHIDMALLMQMLCYANIINGLKTSEKKKLWFELEGKKHLHDKGLSEHALASYALPDAIIEQIGSDIKVMAFGDPKDEYVSHTCVELCSEYLDYLRRLLRPYLR